MHSGAENHCPSRGQAAKTMDEDYKGHHIQSVPRQLPESGRWTAHVVINWTVGSRVELRQFEVERGFATQEETEMGGLIFARKWIDGGRHGSSNRRIQLD